MTWTIWTFIFSSWMSIIADYIKLYFSIGFKLHTNLSLMFPELLPKYIAG